MEISFTNYKYANEVMKKGSENDLYPIKNILVHALVFTMIALLVSFLFSGTVYWIFFTVSKQLLFLFIFLLMGLCHILFFSKWIKFITEQSLAFSLTYSLLFAFTMGLIVFLYFYIIGQSQPQLAITAAFSFILPLIIGIAYTCFTAIETIVEIEPWFVPAQKITTQKRTDLPNSFPIKFSLKIYYFDEAAAEFDMIVAGGLRLGRIFHDFLLENNWTDSKIQQLNYQLKPYGWVFFVKRFSGFKKLDPALTFFDNDIKENDVIIIERVNITE